MKQRRHNLRKNPTPDEPFEFFPPRDTDPVFEGRDPHEPVKTDWMGKRFPQPWHISAALFVFSLLIYLATMSWTPFPGLPTNELLVHLKLEVTPGVLHALWGWGVRGAARLPGPWTVAAWMGLFSALCGALSVSLLGRLMTRVAFLIRNEPGPDSFRREAQARRLSGLVAGLYLACSIPFWVVSTRSLPGTFHVLGLLVTTWWFSQYQHHGLVRHLLLLGLAYGIGITEHPTFLVFMPLALFLIGREMFRWHALRTWRAQFAFWGGLLLGLCLYAVNAVVLYRQGLASAIYTSPADALLDIWKQQLGRITIVRYSPGFLVAMFFCLAPWLTLFTMSRRSPWFYEWGQILVRLIFIGGLIAALYNAAFAPWALMGMRFLLVMPSVLMAVAMGYMAGEFWIIGEQHLLLDFRILRRWGRRAASGFALVLPLVVLAGGLRNWEEVDGRHGRFLYDTAEEILADLEGTHVVFSSGVLDDTLRMAVRERWAPVLLISAPRTSSPVYLNQIARYFSEETLRRPLLRGDFITFVENLMLSETGPRQSIIIDLPEFFREYGYLLPSGFYYRIQPEAPSPMDLSRLVADQHAFWSRMTAMADQPVPRQNPAFVYQEMLLLMASRIANNLGVLQAEQGDEDGAVETFRIAWRIFPQNASALLNLLGMAVTLDLPDREEIEQAWTERLEDLKGERWGLALYYGHVWNARQWLSRGWGWALSGVSVKAPGARFLAADPDDDREVHDLRDLLDRAYLLWQVPTGEDSHFYSRLMRDPRDTSALLSLTRLAIRRGDLEVADVFMSEALVAGLPAESLKFDQAMARVANGQPREALEALERLSHLTPGDARVWAALLLLAEEDDSRGRHALWTLRNHFAADPMIRMVIASVFISRGQWNNARAELERALELDARNASAWEMMMVVANELGHARLREASMRALVARDPHHYIQYQNRGVDLYEQGKLAEAESVFREGLRRHRSPILLNNLAHVIRLRGGNLEEALMLANEALRRQPGSASMHNTRAEIYMAMGRLDDARRDVLEAQRRRSRNADPLLHLIERYLQAGDAAQAAALARVGEALRERMNPVQQQRLDQIQRRFN